ncbi:MAG TPA: hypothetical protein VMU18_02875, partial [Rhodoblastus sp.]|nr:hypothetical protein [Rhodoblastus sp.]
MNRRDFLTLTGCLAAFGARAQNPADFPAFVQKFRGAAQAAGVSEALFESVAAGLAFDPSLA